MTTQEQFLIKAVDAARCAQHVFPEHAACEAALESAWGTSQLALKANNLFGQKQSHPPVGASLSLPTKEYLHGAWVAISASWACFENWPASFAARMTLLENLGKAYPAYAAALAAKDGVSFIGLVSRKWSTDPARAEKVLQVWSAHKHVFASNFLEA